MTKNILKNLFFKKVKKPENLEEIKKLLATL